MKHIIRLIMLALMLGIVMPEATAQVSVRRSNSSRDSSSSSSRKKDKKDKETKPNKTEAKASSNSNKNDDKKSSATRQPNKSTKNDSSTAARTNPTRKVRSKEEQSVVDGNSQRQQSFAEYQRKDDGFRPWQHVVYRELDMEDPVNASLYYPIEPMDGLTNLFRVILDGICSNRLKGYEYLDGREIFDEKYVVKPKDVLDKFQILYQEKPGIGREAKPTYTIEEIDVPCNEVLSYFIKERWEFNQKTSKYGPRILAICPVLHRTGDFGGDAVKYPMFWLNYEDLRPLLRDHLIMSNGMNNTPRFTIEEFFTLEQYKGDIYKVQNTRGLSLMQQYPDPDTLKLMRGRIEAELRGFGDSIWVYEPTEADLAVQDSIKAAKRAERRAKRGNSTSASNDGKKNRRTKEEVDMAAVEDAKADKEDEIDNRIESTGKAHSARRSARR